jgi:hypothetical protein
MSPAMFGASRAAKSQNGALMQTLRVCVRKRRCLLKPPRGYGPPWNPRPKASRPQHPGSWISLPDTLDNGRACPLTQPGGIPSPSTPGQPSAGWTRASALPPWTGPQGALLPENPAPGISCPGTPDNGRACPLTQPGGVPSPSTPDQPSAGWMRASALPPWTGTQGALLPENPAPETSLSRPMDGRLAGQSRAAIRRRPTSRTMAPAPHYLAAPCLP